MNAEAKFFNTTKVLLNVTFLLANKNRFYPLFSLFFKKLPVEYSVIYFIIGGERDMSYLKKATPGK